jgi:hypothetical protein
MLEVHFFVVELSEPAVISEAEAVEIEQRLKQYAADMVHDFDPNGRRVPPPKFVKVVG